MSVNTNVKFANQIAVTSVLTEECQTNRHYRINMLASRRPKQVQMCTIDASECYNAMTT